MHQNTNQALAGYAQQGYPTTGYAQQTGQDAPPVQTRLSGFGAHLESLNGEYGVIADRLERIADRLLGPQPKDVPTKDGGVIRGSGGGLMTSAENHLEHTAMIGNRMRAALERLETL